MDAARSFEEWRAAAVEHDAHSGAEEWRAVGESTHYDAASLRESMERMRSAREAGDGRRLETSLTEDLYRHLESHPEIEGLETDQIH